MNHLPHRVRIVEVGPRDGLQNEPAAAPTPDKVRFLALLADSGLPVIEVTSFTSPKWIPALADADEVMLQAPRGRGTILIALVPNLEGYRRARAAGADAVAVFISATEAHTRKNLNATIAEQLARIGAVCDAARADGLPVRGYISMAFGCPYEGEVPVERVVALARDLRAAGCAEIALGDTVGVANPVQVLRLVERVAAAVPLQDLALHLHDTRGLGLANAIAGLEAGVTTFDAAAGGLGGCPYAAGAAGNVATEDLVYLMHSLGVATGVDLDRLCEAARFIGRVLGRPLPSRYNQAQAAARKG